MAGRGSGTARAGGVAAIGCAVGTVALARPAAAHEVGRTRFDAPLPVGLLVLGAGATVALTAAWLAVADGAPEPSSPWVSLRIPAWLDRTVRTTVRPLFALAVVGAVGAGLLGRQVAAENVATLFVWPVWIHGLAILAVLVGTPWPLLSPWRTAYRLLVRLEGDAIALLDGYPDRLAEWPALGGFLLFIGVVETLTAIPDSPRLTAVVVACYAAVMLAGALLVGPAWLRRADPLAVLYRMLGRVAPLCVDGDPGDRRVAVRPPWHGARGPLDSPALAAFVVAALYTVSFDGYTSTRGYQDVLAALRPVLGSSVAVPVVVYGLGLAAFLATFAATAAAAERLGRSAGPVSTRAASLAFAPTVLPIAAAYEVAHNYPYVVRNLGQLWGVAARPLRPAAEPLALLGWLSIEWFWWSQVGLVVAGHVVAVVAAHRAAADRYGVAAGRRAHLPLVALMVAYTVLSLWIVSQPLVR